MQLLPLFCTAPAAERQEPTSTSEMNLSSNARKRKATQQDASASPLRKTEMNVPPRRVRHKAPPVGSTTAPTSGTGSLQRASTDAEDIYPLRLWKPSQGNKDPRTTYDFAMQDAAALLSDKPTLPERLHAATDPEMAYNLPDYHCAFRSCGFECATQAALAEHIALHHATALHDLALRWSSQVGPAQATFQAYQDLLTQRLPTVWSPCDLVLLTDAVCGDSVPTCWVTRSVPRSASCARVGSHSWTVFRTNKFHGYEHTSHALDCS